MSGLAKLLSQQGLAVTGSDLKPGRALDALADLGIETWVGHRPERMGSPDLVVASSAVPGHDPELVGARERGIDVWQRPQLLQALTVSTPAVGFAGTHGKTTSTALAATAARAMGLDPTFLVGGEMVAYGTGSASGDDRALPARGRRGVRDLSPSGPAGFDGHQHRGRPSRFLRATWPASRRRSRWWPTASTARSSPASTTPGCRRLAQRAPSRSASGCTRKRPGGCARPAPRRRGRFVRIARPAWGHGRSPFPGRVCTSPWTQPGC